MANIANMPVAGIVVIFIILSLFALAVVILFTVYSRYKILTSQLENVPKSSNSFLRFTVNEYAEAYSKFGTSVNTPAIIENSINTKLSGLLLCERFLSNAVSLFVTLGLFGTFLGLSLSVGSLTELISYSNTSEWLSVLDSVGGGLMSALSGMGVAFYTSLFGVACSIILTILRSIFSPDAARETMQTRMELWLDETIAAKLPATVANSDVELLTQLMGSIKQASDSMEDSLKKSTDELSGTLQTFNDSINSFNKGVTDFSDFNHALEGTVERMDLALRNGIRRSDQ